jgi:3-methylcrotonyl-CoA carboxylase beta subunit
MKRQGLEPDPDQLEQIQREVGDYFERTSSSSHLTSEIRDDGLIDPTDTRNTLGMALSASLKASIARTPGGVLRI